MSQSNNAARFALDEDKARDWIARAIAQTEGTGPRDHALPEVTTGYDPAEYDDTGTTYDLVSGARDAGIITGPGTVDYDHSEDEDGAGYVWLLYVAGPGSLKLSSLYAETRHGVGDPDAMPGADSALAVLREAVRAGNALLDDLAAYVASVATPPPGGTIVFAHAR